VEPAHEALLRQWGLLQGWLAEDTGLLTVLDGIKRGARDWAANGKATSWLAHSGDRLRAAEQLLSRPDLASNLEPTDKDYIEACKYLDRVSSRRMTLLKALVWGAGFASAYVVFFARSLISLNNALTNLIIDLSPLDFYPSMVMTAGLILLVVVMIFSLLSFKAMRMVKHYSILRLLGFIIWCALAILMLHSLAQCTHLPLIGISGETRLRE
jgi:hypothetical protein